MQQKWATNNFETKWMAVDYYLKQHFTARQIFRMLDRKVIKIGKPACLLNETVSLEKSTGRYFIQLKN